jgi:hypothetical protein
MAVKLITVRRKDDPTVTAQIAPSALRHFPDFERADGDTAYVAPAENPTAIPAPAPTPTPKSRRAAATDDKE